MTSKLVYLLLGILVKQTIDELKSIAQSKYAELKEQEERAVESVGLCSPSELAERMQTAELANGVRQQFARRKRFWQYVPFVVYLLLTIAVFCYAVILRDSD